LKKIPQTDAIFENVFEQNQASDDNPRSLRISIDTKAKVKIGNLSRNGKARTLEAKQADDHDTEWQSVLVPFGILNTQTNQLSIYFGQSAETSDFIVDWALLNGAMISLNSERSIQGSQKSFHSQIQQRRRLFNGLVARAATPVPRTR
jgi:hypothetical protein